MRRFMSDTKNARSKTLSRRALLSACGAAPALLAASAFASPPKASQACVSFLDSPRGDRSCGNCRLFRAPSSRLDVNGPITEHCSCRIWLPVLA
jgi:hypothetical protein